MNIQALFPSPLGIAHLGRPLSDIEKATVESFSQNVRSNSGNFSTIDNKVLEHENFKFLKKDIDSKVNEYFTQIYNPKGKVRPKIVLSWLNYTKQDGFHHKHNHPNSFISGVLYINANPQYDKINFYDNKYEALEIVSNSNNKWNSKVWSIPVNIGDLVLFPSYMDHGVEPVEHDFLRISLAFNVWLEGDLGTDERLTTLQL